MLAVVSPAKKLDFDTPLPDLSVTQPKFTADIAELTAVAKTLSRSDLSNLMGISDSLADLNYQRFQAMGLQPAGKRPAALAFKGDTYVGLAADQMSDADLNHAQGVLRILSGLYGYLRPLDEIDPYRLEMGTKLASKRGKDLYAFWGSAIAKAINDDLAEQGSDVLVNLASNEYFKAVDKKTLTATVITPAFKQDKAGVLKSLGMMSKRARGAMAKFMIVNRLSTPADLKDFNLDGYVYRPDLSTETEPMFVKQG